MDDEDEDDGDDDGEDDGGGAGGRRPRDAARRRGVPMVRAGDLEALEGPACPGSGTIYTGSRCTRLFLTVTGKPLVSSMSSHVFRMGVGAPLVLSMGTWNLPVSGKMWCSHTKYMGDRKTPCPPIVVTRVLRRPYEIHEVAGP